MSNFPEVTLAYKWYSEHEQKMNRMSPWPLVVFHGKPITGPILQIGYRFTGDDGQEHGAAFMVDPFPCAPSAPADEDKRPLIKPGCGVEGDGEIGFNTLTGNYGIVPPCGPFAAPSPQVPEKKGDKG